MENTPLLNYYFNTDRTRMYVTLSDGSIDVWGLKDEDMAKRYFIKNIKQ